MSIVDSLLSGGGDALMSQLTGRLGINAEQATSAFSALVPALAGGMKEKLANNDTGLASLLTGEKMTQLAGDVSNLGSPAAQDVGNSLVSRIFNSGETSNIISTVAEKVGISSDTVSKLLPVAATLVGGFVSKHVASGGDMTEALAHLTGEGGLMGTLKGLAAKVFGA